MLTQIVISCPPEVDSPSVQIKVDGKEYAYTRESILKHGRKAFIEVNEFWLIYIDGISVQSGSSAQITLISKGIVVGSIRIDKITPGIERYYKKDFFIRRYLPNEIFIDIIIEEQNERGSSRHKTFLSPSLINAICKVSSVQHATVSNTNSAQHVAVPISSADSITDHPQNSTRENSVHRKEDQNRRSGILEVRESIEIADSPEDTQDKVDPQSDLSANQKTMQEEGCSLNSIVEKKGSASTLSKMPQILPPPPGMRVRSAVSFLEGTDILFKTLFPRVGWKPVVSLKGTIYEKTSANKARDKVIEARWREIEEDFKKKFCIRREQNIEQFTKKPINPKKKEQILNERQELLLSIVFESIRKKKLSLSQISSELAKWIDTEESTVHMEDIVNLCDVFPSEKDCAKILEYKNKLTDTEELLKRLLLGGCTKNKLVLFKYISWAEPSLNMLLGNLNSIIERLVTVEQDTQLPLFLVCLLHIGNLVNYKYAETASKTEVKGFHLSSVSAFANSSAEMANNEGCKLSLMELLIISTRDVIDFSKIVSTYEIFRNVPLRSLKEQHTMIHAGFNEISSMNDFQKKTNRLQNTQKLLKKSGLLISEIEIKIENIAAVYAVSSGSITESMVDAIGSIKKHACLFR